VCHTAANWTSFAYITKGALRVGPNDGLASDAFNTLVLSAEEGETGVQLTATQPGTELVLVAGEPLDQPVVQYGPFVMTTMDEIRKTIIDCESSRAPCEWDHRLTAPCRPDWREWLRDSEEVEEQDWHACEVRWECCKDCTDMTRVMHDTLELPFSLTQ
jgi:hypothetical protein